jgi:hypothetical protein
MTHQGQETSETTSILRVVGMGGTPASKDADGMRGGLTARVAGLLA